MASVLCVRIQLQINYVDVHIDGGKQKVTIRVADSRHQN